MLVANGTLKMGDIVLAGTSYGKVKAIYEQEQPDGRFLKHIKFRFPVYFGDRETQELCWDNESTVETCVLLSKLGSKLADWLAEN